MDNQTRSQLDPLPETIVAALTLRDLPGVHTDLPLGWAPAALAVVFGQLANRPGTIIHISKSHNGAFKTSFSAGTLIDSEREVYPHPGSWYGGEIAMNSCELCGRPGRRHREPSGVYCDACFELSAGRTPTFEPRLPLTVDAAEALRSLPVLDSLPSVPAGWAPLVRSVLKRLGDGSGRGVIFEDRGDYLTVAYEPRQASEGGPGEAPSLNQDEHSTDVAPSDVVIPESEMRRILVALSRERCRFCSRPVVEGSVAAGRCDGCMWTRSRGWASDAVSAGVRFPVV